MAARQQDAHLPAVPTHATFTIARRARHWEVRDPAGELVCLTVYKCGAQEVLRRMALTPTLGIDPATARF